MLRKNCCSSDVDQCRGIDSPRPLINQVWGNLNTKHDSFEQTVLSRLVTSLSEIHFEGEINRLRSRMKNLYDRPVSALSQTLQMCGPNGAA